MPEFCKGKKSACCFALTHSTGFFSNFAGTFSSERRLVAVDGVVGVQRAVWAGHPETLQDLHQPGAAERRRFLRGHVRAEDHLQRALPRLVPLLIFSKDEPELGCMACSAARQ